MYHNWLQFYILRMNYSKINSENNILKTDRKEYGIINVGNKAFDH